MKAFTSLFLMVLVVLLSSCNSNPKQAEVPVIDLTKVTDETDFSLADVADNFRLIALETNENCLLGPSRFAVGDRYIVACSYEGMISRLKWFTNEGDFIQQIYDFGKGPEEYMRIRGMSFSADESIFSFSDSDGKEIVQVSLDEDLKRRVISPDISFPLVTFFQAGANRFFLYSMVDSSLAVEQDAQGNRLFTYMAHKNPSAASRSLQFFMSGEDVFIYQSVSYGDTLYRLSDGTAHKEFALYGGPAPDHSIRNSGGFSVGVYYMFGNYSILNREEQRYEQEESGRIRVNIVDNSFYALKRGNLQASKIHRFLNPVTGTDIPLDEEIPSHMTVDYGTDKLIYVWTAMEFKELVASTDPESFHPDFREQILEIDRNLKEDDNPVLLIGDLR